MIDTSESLAGTSSYEAASNMGGLFMLVLAASARARELGNGHFGRHKPMVKTTAGPKVTALQEIEAGLLSHDYILRHADQVAISEGFDRVK
jgi:DNA-directed RNA polymerase subunit K/omega